MKRVAVAVSEFRADSMTEDPGLMTEFTVAIHRPPVEHKIRLDQVEKWTDRSTRDGPAGSSKEKESGAF
jgi:hypothetical protein